VDNNKQRMAEALKQRQKKCKKTDAMLARGFTKIHLHTREVDMRIIQALRDAKS